MEVGLRRVRRGSVANYNASIMYRKLLSSTLVTALILEEMIPSINCKKARDTSDLILITQTTGLPYFILPVTFCPYLNNTT